MKKYAGVCIHYAVFIFFAQPLEAADNSEWTHFCAATTVKSLAEEADVLWMGTDVGLIAFDKLDSNYTLYNHLNSGLPHPEIRAVAVDNEGTKWIGTKKGLVTFKDTTWTVLDSSNSKIPSGSKYFDITDILIDDAGNKWIAAYNGGLVMMADTGSRIYDRTNSNIPANSIQCLSMDFDKNLWIGTYSGVGKLEAPAYETIDTSLNAKLPAKPVWSIQPEQGGAIWINAAQCFVTCGEGGLVYYDGVQTKTYDGTTLSVLSNKVNDMAVDGQGVLWMATNNGVGRYDGNEWEAVNSGLPNQYAYCIMADSRSDIWAGTSGGLAKYDGTRWISHPYSTSPLTTNNIWEVRADGNGATWIGTDKGLYRYDKGAWSVVNDENIDGKGVSVLYEDFDGILWAVTGDKKVLQKIGNIWQEYSLANSGISSKAYINSIHKDRDGTVWIGTSRGLAKNTGGRWTIIDSSKSDLPHNNVRAIMRDSKGSLWVGGGHYRYESGIAQMIGNEWLVHTEGLGMPVQNVYDIVADDSGNVWVGGQTGGSFNYATFIRYNGSTWADTFKLSRSQRIVDLEIAPDGHVWAAIYNSVINTDLTWSVLEWTPDSLYRYGIDNSPFTGASIHTIDFDITGRQWVGTAGGGLYMRETGMVTRIANPRKPASKPGLKINSNRMRATVTCALAQKGRVSIALYDMSGRLVKTITRAMYPRAITRFHCISIGGDWLMACMCCRYRHRGT